MAYTRQYTEGVGWENEPSINTPISAENLNQMDTAIQDVDEATYNEFLAVYAAIAQAGGGNAVNFYIDNASNNTLASDSSVLYNITLKKDDIIFLYMSVDGDYTQAQTGWEVAYKMYVSGTLTTFTAVISNYLYGEGAMWHEAFNLDLARGTWLILRVADTTHFDCIGKIDPASGGGGAISYYSDATETVDDGNIYTDRSIFHGNTPSVGDMLFLRVDVDAHKTSGVLDPWYVVYGTAQSSVGHDQIYDCRSAFATIAFWQDIAAGSTLIMSYDGYVWDLRAVIPASGGGGASSLANLSDTTISSPTAAQPLTYDATNSKWINGGIIPVANGGTGNATGYVQAGRKANTNIGTQATAEGYQATASGNYSHAEGYQPTASGNYSHAEGSGTTASAPNSHTEGASTQATANSAHAEGNGSKATGTASHAENASNTASGSNSHAGGNNSTAGGTYSFVHGRDISIGTNGHYAAGFGQGTVANYSHQFVVGKYNNNKSTSILEVGIGTGANAKANGLELDTSGNLKTAGTITDGNGNVLGDSLTASDVQDIKNAFVVPTTSAQMPILFDETGAEYIVGWYKLAIGTKKPVYQRMYVTTSPSNNTDTKIIDLPISFEVKKVDGILLQEPNNVMPINIYYGSSSYVSTYAQRSPEIGIRMVASTSQYQNKTCYITIQYTKTTDTPV